MGRVKGFIPKDPMTYQLTLFPNSDQKHLLYYNNNNGVENDSIIKKLTVGYFFHKSGMTVG